MAHTHVRRLAAVLGFSALVLGACGDNGGSGGGEPAVTSLTAAADTPVEPSTTTEAGETISVEVRGGEVVGGATREEVELEETVNLVVSSDVADEVHVHGYDLFEPVEAGGTARISFVADIPGVFEVELEGTHLRLLELEVS